MTKDDIYDHLAQVYLGKRKVADDKKKKQFNAWLVINIFITLVIFGSAFYGMTAFLNQRRSAFEDSIIFPLHKGLINIAYDFRNNNVPQTAFALMVPHMNAAKYSKIQFSIRAKEEGSPGIVKIVLNNTKKETASYYVRGVNLGWQEVTIPLDEFPQITDWNNLTDVSFVLESWNVDKSKGIVLIDDVRFAS